MAIEKTFSVTSKAFYSANLKDRNHVEEITVVLDDTNDPMKVATVEFTWMKLDHAGVLGPKMEIWGDSFSMMGDMLSLMGALVDFKTGDFRWTEDRDNLIDLLKTLGFRDVTPVTDDQGWKS
jgi:hypothetical protein